MKPIADILEDAARLIEKPGAWTQSTGAADALGNPVDYTSPQAVCFCLYGAVVRAAEGLQSANAAIGRVDEAIGYVGDNFCGFIEWNDAPERTQSEVVAKLREAATLARGDTA